MGLLRNFVTPLHKATPRDYLARMLDDKVECMKIAKEYEEHYWDGDRRFGYGGYKYIPGRWKTVAASLIDTYSLDNESKVLDIGAGKCFLLYELKLILPDLVVCGLDVSQHAIKNAKEEIRPYIQYGRAEEKLSFADDEFDLAISLGTLHNLRLPELSVALPEMARVSKSQYVMMESFRNELELFNLQCWALTAETFLDDEEWRWLFKTLNFNGDYEFIYFE